MILCQVDISSALFESSTIDPATPRHRAMDRLQHYFYLTEANSVVLASSLGILPHSLRK